ncbi:Sec-independent protein translocase subunit TatA/TatB [Alkalibacter mobilis]|uniref:Sec-independent protein translocase subunit TatA/TatB n=1 Tax=Alkalibacter mobilis TaxID=2787712 RepID=UPI00189D4FCD|nr:twin-arginine translocase TatA/TatE family subunit [Alkalibacter mobilis]MBF7096775.1 twin-arginine translocase TatA/TatE family subunit [Alkalibacter mobilis]
MRIGTSELIVVLIVALLVLGPEKLPSYAKKLGSALNKIKSYTSDLTKNIDENIVEPMAKVKEPIEKATKPLNTIKDEINKPFIETKKSIENIGKTHENKVNPPEAESLEVVSQ